MTRPGIQIISLEMNELNFEFVEHYIKAGHLPGFAKLFRLNGFVKTTSEDDYRNLEPWIQWPTVYTGKSFADHNIFRLGDATQRSTPQIWEQLEALNVSVGAISPMNARNDCRAPAFFLPDPWTETKIAAGPNDTKLFKSIRNIVNANSHGRFAKRDLLTLARIGASKVRMGSIRSYLRIVGASRKAKWARALLLDRLLADMFIGLWKRSKPGYSSLFVNAVAHVQHHHLYDSQVYAGPHRNPEDYRSGTGEMDPLLFAYEIYDGILQDILALPGARVLVTTGLSQIANKKPYYQYRFVDHAASLARIGVAYAHIAPRMSRDFSLFFLDDAQRDAALAAFSRVTLDGEQLVRCEARNAELFCQIAYRGTPDGLARVSADGRAIDMRDEIAIVSIENAIHQTIGFHSDSAERADGPQDRLVPLSSIFDKTLSAFAA